MYWHIIHLLSLVELLDNKKAHVHTYEDMYMKNIASNTREKKKRRKGGYLARLIQVLLDKKVATI